MADNTPNSSIPIASQPALPEGFITIAQANDVPNERLGKDLYNVIGFVTDYQPPVPTRGSDWKCTMEIKDFSTKYESRGIKVNIFWLEDKMPQGVQLMDGLVIRKVKISMFGGQIILLANKSSEFHFLTSSDIPQPQNLSSGRGECLVPWRSYPATSLKAVARLIQYMSETKHMLAETGDLPSVDEFQIKTARALKVRDKFSLLKDLEVGKHHNLIAQVIRVFAGGRIGLTMYVTDYTAHPQLYDYSLNSYGAMGGRDGDGYGYTRRKANDPEEWPGPFGRQTIQLTLFDDHAEFAKQNVKLNDWILLRNVDIKYSRTGGLIEGYLRTDGGKVNIEVLKLSAYPSEANERWKNAVRRKKEYETKLKIQMEPDRHLEEINGVEARPGEKRKADEGISKLNSKQRRKLKREQGRKKAGDSKSDMINTSFEMITMQVDNHVQKPNINEHVRCNFPSTPTTQVELILKGHRSKLNTGQIVTLPFVNARYRANVRVVGYFPHKLTDFAVGRRITEYDMLSDYSGDEDTDHEEEMRTFRSGKGFGKKEWEWRFALEVESAEDHADKERMWLVVDNMSGQGLFSMDAENLRENPTALAGLKQKLDILWGDLEEQKSALMKKQALVPPSSIEERNSSPPARVGDMPSLDSDDEETPTALQERLGSVPSTPVSVDVFHPPVKNRAFTCCIKQYGIKVREDDPALANAGNGRDGIGRRWERRYGLFGVNIV